MKNSQSRQNSEIIAIALLVWLSFWPVFGSTLSFFGAVPADWAALAYFASSPEQWRVAFFAAGCFGLLAAWLVYAGKPRFAFGAALLFAALYVPVFPIVWGTQSIAMVAAVIAVVMVGIALFRSSRRKA